MPETSTPARKWRTVKLANGTTVQVAIVKKTR